MSRQEKIAQELVENFRSLFYSNFGYYPTSESEPENEVLALFLKKIKQEAV
jgi:hypothetical protein